MFWTGLRRSLGQLILGVFFSLFLLVALLGDPQVARCFGMLAAVYALAFIGLGGEWFWARWFAIGVANFGALSLLSILQIGFDPVLLIWGGAHLIVIVLLAGPHMAERYELREGWRQRLKLQESSVEKLRAAVIAAGTTLPFLILYAFGPSGATVGWLAMVPLALGAVALVGLLRRRTWGIFALGATAVAGVVATLDVPVVSGDLHAAFYGAGCIRHFPANIIGFDFAPSLAALAAGAAFLIFVPAMVRFLRDPHRG